MVVVGVMVKVGATIALRYSARSTDWSRRASLR